MPTVKLVGADDGTVDGQLAAAQFTLFKYTASATGTCSEVRIKCLQAGYAKVAVYADSAGVPGARLAKQDTSTAVAAGWNTIALEASCSIVSGTAYWLAFVVDTSIFDYGTGTIPRYWTAVTYSTWTFPNPCPDVSGYGYMANVLGYIAGWGTAAAAAGRSFGYIIG